MIIATFNVENLFARAKALKPSMDADTTSKTLAAHAEINDLFNKPTYDETTKQRILELLDQLGLLESDESDLVRLRIIRGKLLTRHKDKTVDIVASGRADWIGFVELRTEAVDDLAMDHTAMVMRDLKADVLGVVEAESRPTLEMFSTAVLDAVPGGKPYERCMLVEGNDDRGIDVGLLWRESFELKDIRTHVFDRDSNGEIFSRDCCEYHLQAPSGSTLLVLMNHFKSKGYSTPADPGGGKKRTRQAKRVADIYHSLIDEGFDQIAVLGDLNDTPDSKPLNSLVAKTDLQDISTHQDFDWQGRHGTYGGSNTDKIDYVLLSPALFRRAVKGGVFRKGVWRGPRTKNPWPIYDTLTAKVHEASDHAAVWAELDL
ncbi:endonuclease/exonuclease/phosphatase family protein [Mycobacterium sp.]|uniref:endonuclease/exonuclease/phosphatase family protein n=1 Tax=Mycobacterium sp. TaxID=1785 RepID=UPI002D26E56E|nr:endonuclease/exonuclease/phosphatase family protein [Mycobacterium sp.]HZA08559.1 endonuclease/exonuclease/phosphatase family protein [Mycobacterium sp.]